MKRFALVSATLLILLASSSAAYAAPDQLNVNIDGIGGISAPL